LVYVNLLAGYRPGFSILGVCNKWEGLNGGMEVDQLKRLKELEEEKWLGHASLITIAFYADTLSKEERAIAARLWV
jgi:hypothetical protein